MNRELASPNQQPQVLSDVVEELQQRQPDAAEEAKELAKEDEAFH